MIKTYTTTTVQCDNLNCYKTLTVGLCITDTKTQTHNIIKRQIRAKKWIWTREDKCFCPNCAKKFHLRNANK